MKNEITVKPFVSSSLGVLRTAVDEYGRNVFCLKDACSILGMTNVTACKRRLKSSGTTRIVMETKGKPQNFIFITESNLYKLILQSRKEEAEPFVDWVTEEVLPSIRRTGKYELKSIMSSEEAAEALLEDHKTLLLRNALLEKQYAETEEARAFTKHTLDSGALKDLYDVPKIINIEGITKNKMLEILRSGDVLDEQNLPLQKYIDKKCFRVMSFSYNDGNCGLRTNQRVYVYKSGINLIIETIKKAGGIK